VRRKRDGRPIGWRSVEDIEDSQSMPEAATAQPGRRSGSIYVCPLSAVPFTVRQSKACRLVTCLQDDITVETPKLIAPDKHLRLPLHDIAAEVPGHIAPREDHIEALIAFARDWGGEGDMVVHCWAGISRSTAAAFTALCAINPLGYEAMIAARLRQASPTAHPNRLMIRLADQSLGRSGRMVRAIEAIGPGSYASEGVPFALPADHS
jgi:predicted protein tyrosine phosphatase